MQHERELVLGLASSSSQIMRRKAFCAPSQTFWQLTKAKRTVCASPSAGAVRVRPIRLPCPLSSRNRYQYVQAGRSPPTKTRQVWSATARARAGAVATTRSKAGSSATSTVSETAAADPPAAAMMSSRRVK
jgi:hypothetical protein